MPPRRSHKKSRAGCRRCKARKIKCDEVHPRCGNCYKHGVGCDFENRELAGRFLSVLPATPIATQPASPVPRPINTSFPPSCCTTQPASPTLTAMDTSPPSAPDSFLRTPGTAAPGAGGPALASTPPLVWPSPSMLLDTSNLPSALAFSPLPPLSSSSSSSSSSPQHTSRMMELRLMHHYTTSTAKTLSARPSPAAEDTWQVLIPRAAFSSSETSFLAEAILSVAALHLRALHPHDRDIVRACHAYMASSIAEYRAALARGINDANAEALFLTATLLSFQSTASRIFLRDDGILDEDGDVDLLYHPDRIYGDEPVIPQGSNRSRSTYTLPLSWFHSFQGVKTIVATSWLRMRHSAAVQAIVDSQPVLELDLDALGASMHDDSASLAASSFFGHLLDGVDDELAVEDDEEAGLAHATRQSYLHAVAVLNWAHRSPHVAAALAFPATVAKRFVDLIEARRPRALAVLACFFALLKRLDGVWWLRDVARREVMGIVSLFECGSPWWRHLEWPVRIALLEGNAVPAGVWGADPAAEERRMMFKHEDGPVDSVVDHIEMYTQSQSHVVCGMGLVPT